MASPIAIRGYYTFDGSSADDKALLNGATIVVSQLRAAEVKSLDSGLARRPWDYREVSLEFRLTIGGLPVAEDENVIPRGDRGSRVPKTFWGAPGLVELWKMLDRIQERAKGLGTVVEPAVEVRGHASVQTPFHKTAEEKK